MGDAMPSASEEGEAEAGEGVDLHGKNEEKAQDMTEAEQRRNGEDIQEQKNEGDDAGEEEEEPGECGFCLFMKSGPCRDSFIGWEQCIEQAEKDEEDIVEKCHKLTFMLKECMEHNSDYYEPVLQAEKAIGEAALEEEEEAAAASQGGANATPPDLQVGLQSENQPSLDASHSQVPTHVHTEEHHIKTEQHTHASSEEHHVSSSLDAPAGAHNLSSSLDAPPGALNLPDSGAAAQERTSA